MRELNNREIFSVNFVLFLCSLSLFWIYEQNLIFWMRETNLTFITYLVLFLVPLTCFGSGYIGIRLLIRRWKEFSKAGKIFTGFVASVYSMEFLILIVQLAIILTGIISGHTGHKSEM